MKLLGSLKKFTTALHNSIKRFPITLILTSLVTILLIFISENSELRQTEMLRNISRLCMSIALGIPLSLILKFTFETKKDTKPFIKIISYIFLVIFIITYYGFFIRSFNMVSYVRYVALSFCFYFIAIVMPYLWKKSGLELYVIKLILRFFTTIIYSIVLQLGLSAILFTLDKLLGIKIYSNLYLYIWFIICGIFAPTFFLGGVPSFEEEVLTYEYPSILRILFLYIVMPLLSTYTVILYLYFAKILITLKWPEGMVGHLVLWYSIISVWVIFLIYPLIEINKWALTFTRWLPRVILPLILMMFISLGIRINAYGFTENRYFVVALGIWVLMIMLYFSIFKVHNNKYLLIGFSIIALLSVTGPWSAFNTSISSQNKRLQSLLMKNNMLQNGNIQAATDVSKEDRREISSILSYFENNHSFREVKYLPRSFTAISDMKKTFGFEHTYGDDDYNSIKYFNYVLSSISTPVDTGEYDYLLYFRYPGNKDLQKNEEISVEYNNKAHTITITYRGQVIYSGSLNEFAEGLYKNIGDSPYRDLSPELMTYITENNQVSLKFLFVNIQGNKEYSTNRVEINDMEFDLFINIK